MATALGAGLAGSATLQAATITVTSTADAVPAVDGAITLREAIESANGDAPVNADVPNVGFVAGGADTILFSAAILPATINTYAEFPIEAGGLTIQGPADRTQLTLDAQDAYRHFYIYSSAAPVSISGLTLTEGNEGNGGSIHSRDLDLTLNNVAITSCEASIYGGAVYHTDGGDLTIRDSLLDGNYAAEGGGAVFANDHDLLLVEDSTVTNNDAGEGGGAFYSNETDVTIRRSIVSDNSAQGGGGALYTSDPIDVVIEDSVLERNTAGPSSQGGALYMGDGGTLTIRGSAFNDNSTGDDGGAVYVESADVLIELSTFYSNDAGDDGGALFLYDVTTCSIVNSTFSANTADDGGAIYLYDSHGVTISHSTIVDNSADDDGGGIYLYESDVTLDHTIVANNLASGGDEDLDEDGGEFYVSYSFVEFYDSGVNDLGGNVFGTDPDLAALADNGGPTETHRPNPTSPVIDAGDPAITGEPATDQRGFARVAGVAIDIGAVEINAGSFELAAAPNPVAEGGGPVVFTVSRVGGQDGAVSVDLDFTDGSAANPADYGASDTAVSWNDNEGSPSTLKTVNASIVDDLEVEGDETFSGALSNPQGGATLGAVTSAEVTIQDNDVEAVPVVEIPALGAVGRALLAGAAAAAAMLRLRRKKDE